MSDAFPYKVEIPIPSDRKKISEHNTKMLEMNKWCRETTDHWGCEMIGNNTFYVFAFEEHAMWFKLKFG